MGNGDLSSMSLTLLVNKKSGRIIYGEAGKDFVDLIFSFLALPIGSVLKLLSASKGPKIVGSVSNLYESMDKLPPVLMSGDKSELLNPKVMSSYSTATLKIENGERVEHGDNFYICTNNQSNFYWTSILRSTSTYNMSGNTSTHNISRRAGETCACGIVMNRVVQFRQKASQGVAKTENQRAGEGRSGSAGYVKETVTFIITDDLKVMPSPTIASITLLNRRNINDISQLEERAADVGPDQALALLFASLISTTPLNDVFGVEVSTRQLVLQGSASGVKIG